MANSFRALFDNAVYTAEEARDGGSNDSEVDALWEAVAAAGAALTDAAAQLTGAAPVGSTAPQPA